MALGEKASFAKLSTAEQSPPGHNLQIYKI